MNSYIGHPSQLSGVEEYRLIGGKGDGMRLLQVRNGLGLEFTVSPDRAADIPGSPMRASIIPTYLPAGMWLPRIMTNRSLAF